MAWITKDGESFVTMIKKMVPYIKNYSHFYYVSKMLKNQRVLCSAKQKKKSFAPTELQTSDVHEPHFEACNDNPAKKQGRIP